MKRLAIAIISAFLCSPSVSALNKKKPVQFRSEICNLFLDPVHMPSFDKLVIKGYTISLRQKIRWEGKVTRVELLWSPDYYGTRYVSLRGRDSLFKIAATELLKTPEVKATYSRAKAKIKTSAYESNHYIFIDRIKDPETDGYLNRVVTSAEIANYRGTEYTGGFVVDYFAKNSKLAPKLGFGWDEKDRVLIYPDDVSFRQRLQKVYVEWGVKKGILPRAVSGGIIPPDQFVRMIAIDNEFGYSDVDDYETHWHDWESHIFPWLAVVDVVPILQSRLRLLRKIQAASRGQSAEFRENLKNYIAQSEIYNVLETGMPDAMAVVRMNDPDPEKLALWKSHIQFTLLKVAGRSAQDVKDEILAQSMPDSLRRKIEAMPASGAHITREDLPGLMKKISERFNF
jgi:hypothetical protein